MIRVLVVGKGSYIGSRLISFCEDNELPCEVDELDVENPTWRNADLSSYTSVVLVAGIAHRKETAKNAHLYYEVNRDLAYEVAKAAKLAGVSHFVMLSTMSVYGIDEGVITPETEPNPKSHYGRSKLEGENAIRSLQTSGFRVAILRPPMVYGPGCKGNFNTLVMFANRSPIFPRVNNERSAIYVDNLCAFILLCAAHKWEGTFFPQDEERFNTSDSAKTIAECHGSEMHLSRILGLIVTIAKPVAVRVKKAFGSLKYEGTECNGYMYCVTPQRKGIRTSASEELHESVIQHKTKSVTKETPKPYRVQVLLSTYNGERYLKEQVDSILKQIGNIDVHLLIRDDGSCDGTIELLRDFEREYPERIEVVYGNNIGVNRSFFELMRIAGLSDYYAFSDQDDVWFPDKLQLAIDCLENHSKECPVLYASTSFVTNERLQVMGQTRRMRKPIILENAIIQNICPGHTQVFNRELLDLCLKNLDDDKIYVYDSWVSCVATLYGAVYFDNQSHVLYRQHESNSLGSGVAAITQIATSSKRLLKSQGVTMRTQIEYFLKRNEVVIRAEGHEVLLEILKASGKLTNRVRMLSIPIYRQSSLETILYKAAWVLGLLQ